MDKKIEVRFWHSPLKDVPYAHGTLFPYSTKKRNQIIGTILGLGYSVMIRPMSKSKGWDNDGELIWIGDDRFGQR